MSHLLRSFAKGGFQRIAKRKGPTFRKERERWATRPNTWEFSDKSDKKEEVGEDIHLYLTLAAVLLLNGTATYSSFRRDWVGLRLLALPIVYGSIPSLVLVVLIYAEIIPVAHLEFLVPYRVLVSVIAVVAAEYGKRHLLGELSPISVPIQIAKRKKRIADNLEHDPGCQQSLEDAIDTSDLTNNGKWALKNTLGHPPTRPNIYGVMAAVGTAHMESMLPRK